VQRSRLVPVAMAQDPAENGGEEEGGETAADREELPENWRKSVDEEKGRVYYWNVQTREVSWFRPADAKIASKSPGET
jgi:hypothetical protein